MEAEVTVREIMTREYLGVSEADTVGDAVDLMLEEDATAVVVLRGADPVGMLTPTDALAHLAEAGDAAAASVGSTMSGTVPSVDPDAPVSEAAGVMADGGVGALLVRSDGSLDGLVSERDVVRATATLTDSGARAGSAASSSSEPLVATADADVAGSESSGGEYSTQSVCEICGSLSPSLSNFNGQLVCDDCRDV